MALIDWKDIGTILIALVGGLSVVLCLNMVIAWLMKPIQPLFAKVPAWIVFSIMMVVDFTVGGWCIRAGIREHAKHDYLWIPKLSVGTILFVVGFILLIVAFKRSKSAMKEAI